jgi:prepilin peptidase CpaA
LDPVLLLAVLLFAAMIVSAYTDVARGKVYNWCTYPAVFVGLVVHGLIGYQTGNWLGLGSGLLGLAIGAGLFLLPYRFGLVGGGDVKLMATVGALQGPDFVVLSAFLSAVVGAIFGLSVLIWKGRFREGMRNLGSTALKPWKLKEKAVDDTRLPYGLAIALGTFWAWFVKVGVLG